MAVRLLLTVWLVLLVGRTASTEVFADDALSPAEVPQQTRDNIEVDSNKVEHLVETLKGMIEEGARDAGLEGGASVDELDADPPAEVMQELEAEGDRGIDDLMEEEERQVPDEDLGGETLMGGVTEELEEARHVAGGRRFARVCEHQTLTISCPAGRQIRILSALYGRTSQDFCPHSQIRTTSCRSENSMAQVRASCQGQSSCSVAASNSVFEDPCVGTFKYLEVRYACTGRPTTGCGGWTRWYDRDNPSATGDWETLTNIREENPGQICAAPSGIQARVKGSNTPASQTGRQFLHFNPGVGFVCRNGDQSGNKRCLDYEVRFWCP
ncbi:latrophilin Cirl-like isoform X1 [Branchiostoma floridae]|uniref:Latrophilin Cirl-like isoform X1 n=2 Tax=Branchiostoma floridae TaxID=7739 RepID=A0A9J7L6L7_BRAFL|nr:latrophilin Cirl-like isoform X1 [Branchiostoma floridae]XP_035676916.1 latrophilin Cirl-like isoform X1 [Branchiostoma floridae]